VAFHIETKRETSTLATWPFKLDGTRPLIPASEALVAAMPVARDSHFGDALQFFFYAPKVLLLLTGIDFVMGNVHTFLSPQLPTNPERPQSVSSRRSP